jgi:hypothetical protein
MSEHEMTYGEYLDLLPDGPLKTGLLRQRSLDSATGLVPAKEVAHLVDDETLVQYLGVASQVIMIEHEDAPDVASLVGMAILFGMQTGMYAQAAYEEEQS